ncbi:hypothetical protein LguiA_030057 [Lonicera macranthoides]
MKLCKISNLILLIIILVAGYLIPYAAPQKGSVECRSRRGAAVPCTPNCVPNGIPGCDRSGGGIP